MLKRLAIAWAINVVALFVATWALTDITYGDDWWTLFIAGAVFTLVNWFVKPILAILSIPFIIVTLGIVYFLLNVLMLYITDWVVSGFDIESFWSACIAAVIVSLVNWILHALVPGPRR
jgi:putative membrane protein